MEEKRATVIRDHLKAPRAGAIAGIVFSILFIIILLVIRVSVPANPQDAAVWLSGSARSVCLALNLLPFAGVAFLWFMGVLRDRIGDHEDRFFATVLLGSGLLFLATIFIFSGVAMGRTVRSISSLSATGRSPVCPSLGKNCETPDRAMSPRGRLMAFELVRSL